MANFRGEASPLAANRTKYPENAFCHRGLPLSGLVLTPIAILRSACKWLLCASASVYLAHAGVSITSLTPDLFSPQPVGTSITFTAAATDDGPGPLRYRFRVRPSGGAWAMVRDYSPSPSVVWTPAESDGSYQIEASALDRSTKSARSLAVNYTIRARATTTPVVSATSHPLVALYSAPKCPVGSSMEVRFKLPGAAVWQSTPLKPCTGVTTMNFYVAGMRASSTYQLRNDVIGGWPVMSSPALNFATGAIPANIPPPQAILPLGPPSSASEGALLFEGVDIIGSPTYAVDADLNVIWYAPTEQVYLTRPVPGGDYLVTYGYTTDLANSGLREYDLAGNLVKETNVERMNDQLAAIGMSSVTAFHHEIRKLANGNYMVLAMTELASDAQGPPNDIAGDMILVLDNNLQLLWAWNSFQHLDVTSPAALGETCSVGPAQCVLLNSDTAHDWLHGNSAALTPDGNILYSARHQDLVYKIAYENGVGDGHVIWKLGRNGDFAWQSTDPYPWFSHQHDAEYEDALTISVFDNGNTRVALNGGNSRGQVLRMDEQRMTVTPVVNVDLGALSSALGSAQRLLNGNYVFGNGWTAPKQSEFSEWSPLGTLVSKIGVASVNYRCFRLRDVYSAPYQSNLAAPAVFLYDSASGNSYTGIRAGAGTFNYIFMPATPGFDILRYGDVNADGKTDVVLYNSSNALGYALLGNGDGTYNSVSLFWGPGFKTVAAGDLNGDGNTDFLIYRSTDGTSYTVLSNGDGTFSYKYNLVSPGFTHMTLADFNGDGKADVFYYNSGTGAAYVGISDGAGGFSFSPVSLDPGYDFVETGDFDANGSADLLAYSAASGVAKVGLSNGAGFDFTTNYWSPGFTTVKVLDFNGDGKADIALQNKTSTLGYLLIGGGAGRFTAQSLFWGQGYDHVMALDLNGDGKQDLILYNSANGASYTAISSGLSTTDPFSYQYAYWGTRLWATSTAQP